MEDSMDLMRQNASFARSLFSFPPSVAQVEQPKPRVKESPSLNMTENHHTLEECDESFAIQANLASLSLAITPAFGPRMAGGRSKRMPVPKSEEIKTSLSSDRKVPHASRLVHASSPIPVMNSTAVLTQSLLTSVPTGLPLHPSTNNTLFPDLVKIPEGNGYGSPSAVGAVRKSAIVWFRNDLRVHDNEALMAAHNESLSILPVYCFDPRDYGKSSSGFDRTGPYRAQFLLDCLSDLRSSLRALGSNLVVRVGPPEEVLPRLARAVGAQAVFGHQEVSKEDIATEQRVVRALQEEGVSAQLFWGSTLYHREDLPFSSLAAMPTNYAGFKEQTSAVSVRATLETPEKLKPVPGAGSVEAGEIPSLSDLGLKPASSKDAGSRAGPGLKGGEREALQRLSQFVAEARASGPKSGSGSGSGESLMGANFSCKISPWLAMGCISPRKMYQDLRASSGAAMSTLGAQEGGAGGGRSQSGLPWLVFELLWRDFFRFISMRYNSVGEQAPVPCHV